MILPGRVFKLVLFLVIAAAMPSVIKAQTQMNEIPLGGGSTGGGGGTQSFDGGALLEGDLGGGDVAAS